MSDVTAFDTPLALVGGSLAVLVAATERARRGRPTLVVHPGGPWGGYFAGVHADGRRWDAGMVSYEFTSFRRPDAAPPLHSYDPLRRNDIGRFCDVVRDYLALVQPTQAIAAPQMWLDGRLHPDLLLANGLAALPHLACAPAARAELRARLDAMQRSPWHASRKNDWPSDGRRSAADPGLLDCDSVSRLNHGEVLHQAVFAPFARKLLGRDASHLAALYHRIPWLPLYWPETLLAWLEGRPQALPPTVFSYPVGASVADLCAQLADRMAAAPGVTVVQDKLLQLERRPDGFALQLERHGRVRAARLGWGLTPQQGLQASGDSPDAAPPEPRLPLLLACLRLPREAVPQAFSVVHAVSAGSRLYRVNHLSACAGEDDTPDVRLVVEAHPDGLAADPGPAATEAAVVQALLDDLARMGLVSPGAAPHFARLLRLAGALPLPTAAALAAYADARARLLARLPGLEPVAQSAGPFATSLSDQIVQGLVLAEPHAQAAHCA